MTSAHRYAVPVVCVVLALAIAAPLLFASGFVLAYDMVFTESPALLPSSVGLGPALPRGVPADAVVALVTDVIPGALLQKVLIAGLLVAAGLGAARLVPTELVVIRVVAAVGYVWNAYVAERLFIGHWPLLLAYAALPWIVLAGLALRRGEPRAPARLALAMLPAVLAPTAGLLAAGAAIAAAGRRRLMVTVPLALALNAPWWVPSVLHPAAGTSDPDGVAAFAARGESWAGPVLSVLGLGGIWNADVVPASRDSPITPVVTLIMVGLALAGCVELARRWGPRPARALLLLGAVGVLVGVAGAVPLLDEALRWAVVNVPGAGLVRDGQRFAAWWALVVAIGFALGVEVLAGRLTDPLGRRAVLAGAVLLPVLALIGFVNGGRDVKALAAAEPGWLAAAAARGNWPEPAEQAWGYATAPPGGMTLLPVLPAPFRPPAGARLARRIRCRGGRRLRRQGSHVRFVDWRRCRGRQGCNPLLCRLRTVRSFQVQRLVDACQHRFRITALARFHGGNKQSPANPRCRVRWRGRRSPRRPARDLLIEHSPAYASLGAESTGI